MGQVVAGAPGGVVLVRSAHCPNCGDVEADRDLRCPRCGELCPAASAGRLRPRDVVVNGEGTAAKLAALPAAAGGNVKGEPIVMPASVESVRWREQTERLLAAQEARRAAIRKLLAPLREEDAQLARSVAALKQILGQVSVADGPVVALTTDGARWSRKYDRCQNPECRSPEAKHASGGWCAVCDGRRRHAARRQAAEGS